MKCFKHCLSACLTPLQQQQLQQQQDNKQPKTNKTKMKHFLFFN